MSSRSPKRSNSAVCISGMGFGIARLRLPRYRGVGDDGSNRTKNKRVGRMIMSLNRRHEWQWMPLLFAAALLFAGSAKAETRTVRIATQYGISYLPMNSIAEKNAAEAGRQKRRAELKAGWGQFTGRPTMKGALTSGKPGFGSGGVGPRGTVSARTKDDLKSQRDRRTELNASVAQQH